MNLARVTYSTESDPPFVLGRCINKYDMSIGRSQVYCSPKPGLALEVLMLLQEGLTDYQLQILTGNSTGQVQKSGKWDGLVGMVLRNESEFTAPQLMTTAARRNVLIMIPVFFGYPFCFFHCFTIIKEKTRYDLQIGDPRNVALIALGCSLFLGLPVLLRRLMPLFRRLSEFGPLHLGPNTLLFVHPTGSRSRAISFYNIMLIVMQFFVISAIFMATLSAEGVARIATDQLKSIDDLTSRLAHKHYELYFNRENGPEHQYFMSCRSCGYGPLWSALRDNPPKFHANRLSIAKSIQKQTSRVFFTSGYAGAYYSLRLQNGITYCYCVELGFPAAEITSLATRSEDVQLVKLLNLLVGHVRDTGVITGLVNRYLPMQRLKKDTDMASYEPISLHTLRFPFISYLCLSFCCIIHFLYSHLLAHVYRKGTEIDII